MSDRAGHPKFYRFLEEMANIHDKKNRDYAKRGDPLSNFKMCEDFGVPAWLGAMVRLSDKWSRVVQLAGRGGLHVVKAESLADTLMDLANYAVITRILFEESHGDVKLDTLLKRKDVEPEPLERRKKRPDLLVAELPEKFEVAMRMVKKLDALYAFMDSLMRELEKPNLDEFRRGQLTKRFLSAARASTDIEAVLLARAARETAKQKDLFAQMEEKIKELKAKK